MKGIVVCVDPRAAEEGAKVMEAGGNAFDAAVATAFVQMVVLPFSCEVGGMVSSHLYRSSDGSHSIVDGCMRAGSRVTPDMWAADSKGEEDFNGASLFEDHRSVVGYTSICTPICTSIRTPICTSIRTSIRTRIYTHICTLVVPCVVFWNQ